ncbi:hypothetical protein Tco_1336198 [Tanacetum coccineum]
MVACLERTDGNAEFHQIVDFLTTSPIHYALTISPTIYASYIEQFWATAKSKTVNDVKQIHATVDGKTVIALAEPFNDVCVTPVHTKKVFTNLKRQNKDFSGKITPLFASMLVPPIVEGEGSGQPSKPQPPSSTAPPSHEVQVTTIASQPQKTHTPRRAKRGRDTEIPQSSGPLKKVGNEVVYTGEDDRMVRAATTTTSLEAEQENEGNTSRSSEDSMEHQDDLTDNVPPTPYDSPLSGGYTPGSDEGRIDLNELMVFYTNLSNRVLALETSKTAQDFVINKLKKKVKRLEKNQMERKSFKTKPMFDDSDFGELDVDEAMKNVKGDTVNVGGTVNTATTGVSAASASVTTAGVSISTAEPITPPTTTTSVFEDEDLTIAQTLKIKRRDQGEDQIVMDEELARQIKAKKIALYEKEQREREVQEEVSNVVLREEFDNVQARLDADALLAARLQEEESEQFSINEQARFLVETIAARKKFFAVQRAAEIRNRPPIRTQLRNKMITYLKHMGKYTHNQLKTKSLEEIQMLYKKEHKWIDDFILIDSEKGGKKVTSSEEQSAEKEKKLLEEELQKLLVVVPVEEVYVEAIHVKYPIIDWKVYSKDTKRLFEPYNDDTLWKLQWYMHDLLVWRLYDTCGVYHVSSVRGHKIFMLVEKDYPLTRGLMTVLLANKLQVDQSSEMANELLRKIFYQANRPRQGRLLGIKGFYNLMLLVQVCAATEN